MYLELDPNLTAEQCEVRLAAHGFASGVLRPAATRLDRMAPDDVVAGGSPLWDVFRSWYELGNHTAGLAPMHGGTGIDGLTRHLILEELGWGSAGLAAGLGVAALPFEFTAMLAEMTGNHRLLDEVVAPFVADREALHIGCWAITEPSHGSDALDAGADAFTRARAAGSCRAVADGDEWVITGEKAAWVSNGTIATHALLFCTVAPPSGPAGGGVAMIPLRGPGNSAWPSARQAWTAGPQPGGRPLQRGPDPCRLSAGRPRPVPPRAVHGPVLGQRRDGSHLHRLGTRRHGGCPRLRQGPNPGRLPDR